MLTSRHLRLSRSALVALTCIPVFTGMAEALEHRKMMRLHVQIDEKNSRDYGSLDSLMRKLKSAGKQCSLSDYDYGGGIQCGPKGNWDVLIGFSFAPTRTPELIIIHSIRPHGIDGGEMQKSGFAAFLDDYLKADVTPGRKAQ